MYNVHQINQLTLLQNLDRRLRPPWSEFSLKLFCEDTSAVNIRATFSLIILSLSVEDRVASTVLWKFLFPLPRPLVLTAFLDSVIYL